MARRKVMKVVYVTPNNREAENYAAMLKEAGLEAEIRQEEGKYVVLSNGKIIMKPQAVKFVG